MTRRRTLLLLLTIFAVIGFAVPAQAAGPLRIMLEGDSITNGFHRDYTWRYRFDRELTRQGVAHDLVGPWKSVNPSKGYTAALHADQGFDVDHFSRGASLLRQHAGWVAGEVTAQDPDVVVLAAGLNDLRMGDSAPVVDGHLRSWIENARAAKPTLRIVVSPVLPALDANRPWLDEQIQAYNALVVLTVAQLSTPESPITLADTPRGWSVQDHTYDNVHPNPTGETLIAQRIAEHFRELGILPGQPDIYRATAWNRPIDSRVTLRDRRVTTTWDPQGVNAKVWIQRVGWSALTYNYYGPTRSQTGALVPGATYLFRVQLIRGRLATPFGPVMRVKVPPPPRPAAVSQVLVTKAGVRWTRSPAATSYVVKFRKAGKRWFTRTTTGLSILTPKVRRAKVWAMNAGGRSAVRVGRR